jgi:hypothetical protein
MRRAMTSIGTFLAVAVTAGASLLAVGGSAQATTPARSAWSQSDYNAAESRANLTESTLTGSTVGNIEYLRSLVAPPPAQGACVGGQYGVTAPVLSGGYVYTVLNDYLVKADAATGAVVWRIAADDSFSTAYQAVSVVSGLVIIGGHDCGSVSDPNGILQAFHASDGTAAWTSAMSRDGGSLDQMVVSGGYVVAIGTSEGSGTVVSVHRSTTGAGVWFHTYPSNCASANNALVDHNYVVFTACSNSTGKAMMLADKIGAGTLVWDHNGAFRLEAGDMNDSSGQHVFAVNSANQVVDLSATTGVTRHVLTGATAVIAVDGTRAYTTCGTGEICAYSLATDAKLWSVGAYFDSALGAEAGGVLYLDTGLALNTTNGAELASVWSNDANVLVVGDGRIAVSTESRVLDFYGLASS